jgi:phospholipid/cholesterol/gamma-HCH transport system permease protein
MEEVQKKSWLKNYLISGFAVTGEAIGFASRFFRDIFRPPYFWKEFVRQCYLVGYKSVPLIGITGFIMGLVLTLQSRPSLAAFGAESLLPGMASNSLIKEIGPVITGLICAGNIGSRIGAELGSMKVTEQIDAMEVSAVNPYNYLVITRTAATTLMLPILVIYSDSIGLFGGWVAMNMHTDISLTAFFASGLSKIYFMDIFPSLIKSVCFGYAIGIIACFHGFRVSGGTESVGRAANTSVVAASLAVFIIDMATVQIIDLL